MRIKKRFALVLTIIVISCFTQVGCENNSNNISYGNVVFDRLNLLVMDRTLISDDNIYTNLYRNYKNANTMLNDIGVSPSALSVYDEDYFTKNILLAIAFSTNSDFKYTINRLQLNGYELTVLIDEYIYKYNNMMKDYRVILIDIPKDNLPDNVEIEVEINSIVEK